MSRERIRRVVCVCERKDIAAWAAANRAVMRHIAAEDYLLICPDAQVTEFRAVTAEGWEIPGESRFSKNCGLGLIRARVIGANHGRENWLFQQFLKINTILMSDLGDHDVMLIWDADTIPLRALDFFGKDGSLCCRPAREVHLPYFQTMEKLLGHGKLCAPSFIAQCLPVRVGWVRGMIAEIEARHGAPWVEAVLSVLPGISGSEFSEYEMIGNWVVAKHPGALTFRKRARWLRDGRAFAGDDPSSLRAMCAFAFLRLFFDYIAIERWDGGIFRLLKRAFGRVTRRAGR
jgi:hypothetical protein